MADVVPVAHNFDAGFRSDLSRDELPSNAAYRLRDYIPQLEAPIRKRGGWSYGSPDLAGLGGTAASVAALGFLPFPSDGHLAAVSNAGSVYQLKRFDGAGGALVTDTGDTSIVPSTSVFFHKTGIIYYGIILGGIKQTAKVPKKYYDTTGALAYQSQPLGGTPPQARMGFSWGDYLALGNYYDPSAAGILRNYRMAFSGVGNPDSWTYSGVNSSTLDFPEEVLAGLPVRNAILVWGFRDCHIVTGDTPPPGGNLVRKILFAGNGTLDGRSVTAWRDYAIWANASGVWKSDGSTLTDLTAASGTSVYYRQLVSGFTNYTSWAAVGGIYRDHYVLTIRNAAGTLVSTFVIDLSRETATEWTNIPAAMYFSRTAGQGTSLYGSDEELFFAHSGSPRIGKVSSLWTPSITFASDADGMAVLPSLETGFYKLGSDALKRMRRLFIGYDIRTAGAAPALVASYTTNPEAGGAYTTMTDQYPTTLRYRRKQGHLGRIGLGVGLKFTQVGASADTRIYDIAIEAHPMDATRAGV